MDPLSIPMVENDTRRWIEKAVIGLDLCPFAVAAYQKDRVRIVVSQARHVDGFLDDLDRELDLLAQASEGGIETTLLVHATLFPDFLAFNDFMDVVDAVVEEHGLQDDIQATPFHPDFVFEGLEADDPSHLSQRSPHATLHLLREDVIERELAASDQDPEEIVERNTGALRALGVAGWKALLGKG